MNQMRHATRVKNSQKSRVFSQALRLISRFTRLQIVLLSVAACSIVLGVTSFNPAISEPLTASVQNNTTPNRLSIELDLSQKTADTTTDAAPDNPDNGEIMALDKTDDNSADTEKQSLAAVTLMPAMTNLPDPATAPILPEMPSQPVVKHRTIKSGDNLSTVFQSMGLGARDVYRITQSGKEGKALTRMYPGESLAFVFKDDALQEIIRKKSALESIHFSPSEKGFNVEQKVRTPEVRQVHRSATVTHSLALAAKQSGISDTTTMNMANIFGGVIDFVYDVRSGDRFTVVFEELYLDDEKIDEGNIVAAQYVNRDKTFNAFRYEHDSGEVGYYNEDGVSMRKAFLRAPLDFTRVSSGFNLKRLHPITKKVRPHRGIDYAAPTGTPIFSVGEGRVIASGYSNANGKYVVIKHGESYTTKYLHLSRRSVKNGQRVKQGQIIGKVGCTGLCTGPHLHYEFLVNGVHRNPRTIVNKLPKAKRLEASELPAFTLATAESQDILRHFSTQFELASNE